MRETFSIFVLAENEAHSSNKSEDKDSTSNVHDPGHEGSSTIRSTINWHIRIITDSSLIIIRNIIDSI
jgi:hypothetical protein